MIKAPTGTVGPTVGGSTASAIRASARVLQLSERQASVFSLRQAPGHHLHGPSPVTSRRAAACLWKGLRGPVGREDGERNDCRGSNGQPAQHRRERGSAVSAPCGGGTGNLRSAPPVRAQRSYRDRRCTAGQQVGQTQLQADTVTVVAMVAAICRGFIRGTPPSRRRPCEPGGLIPEGTPTPRADGCRGRRAGRTTRMTRQDVATPRDQGFAGR